MGPPFLPYSCCWFSRMVFWQSGDGVVVDSLRSLLQPCAQGEQRLMGWIA